MEVLIYAFDAAAHPVAFEGDQLRLIHGRLATRAISARRWMTRAQALRAAAWPT
jgi:hypothetical protein